MKNMAGKLSNGNEKDYPNRWSSGTNTSSHRPPFPFQLMTCLWCSSLSSIRLSFAGSELQLGLRTWVNRQDVSCGVLFQAGIEGVDWVGVVALNLFEIKMEILKCKLLFEKLSPIWIFFLSFGTAPACLSLLWWYAAIAPAAVAEDDDDVVVCYIFPSGFCHILFLWWKYEDLQIFIKYIPVIRFLFMYSTHTSVLPCLASRIHLSCVRFAYKILIKVFIILHIYEKKEFSI